MRNFLFVSHKFFHRDLPINKKKQRRKVKICVEEVLSIDPKSYLPHYNNSRSIHEVIVCIAIYIKKS